MKHIAQAILKVMEEVENIDKNMTVGTGSNSYKGVSDKDVKMAIGKSMRKNGLTILPISCDAKTTIERWEETSQYGVKQKQSVFTEVKTGYLLLHESGESIKLEGYGHGVDSQDKAAGKATTYALKYTLLYTFLTPTGNIDDTDKEHSDNKEVPNSKPQNTTTSNKPWLNKTNKDGSITETWQKVVASLKGGGYTIEQVEGKYKISKENKAELLAIK